MSTEREIVVNPKIVQSAMGMYKVLIVDGKTKRVKWEMPDWRHNLILNSGMLMVATRTWADCFRACYAGDGNAQQSFSGGSDTGSSDGAGNFTSIGSTIDFTTFSNGDCILMADGTQAYITARPGTNQATITPDAGISSQNFTVLKTTRTALAGPNTKRYKQYLTGGANCLTVRQENVLTMRRTYDFEDETGPVTIREIGFTENTSYGSFSAWSAGSPTVFSRVVLPAPLSLDTGDSLRVVYQLQLTVLPYPATYAVSTPTITGWPVAPATTTQGTGGLVQLGMSGVSSTGATAVALDSYANEPAAIVGTSYTGMPWDQSYTMWVDKTRKGFAFSWPSSGSARPGYQRALKVTGTVTNTSYTGLTYSHDKQCTWGVGEANVDTWGYITAMGFGYYRSFIGGDSDPTTNCGYYFEFDEDQIKTNIQKLTLRLTYSWSRTLTVD